MSAENPGRVEKLIIDHYASHNWGLGGIDLNTTGAIKTAIEANRQAIIILAEWLDGIQPAPRPAEPVLGSADFTPPAQG